MNSRDRDVPAQLSFGSGWLVFVGLFAASFHVLGDMPNVGGIPIRLSASDLFLLVVLSLAALGWRQYTLALRSSRSAILWLAAIAGVMVLAFVRGPHEDVASRSWAVVKLAGFFVLAAYFTVGWAAASRVGSAGRHFFCRSFVIACWACSVYAVVRYALAFWGFVPDDYFPRMAGFARNPNAFGLLIAVSLVLQLALATSLPLFPARLEMLGAAVLLLGLYLAASRTALIAVLVGLLALAIMRRLRVGLLVRSAATAAVVFVLLFVAPSRLPAPGGPATARPAAETGLAATRRNLGGPVAVRDTQYDVGVKVRIFLAEDAVRLWRSNPVLGAGLGGFLHEERRLHEKDGSFIYVNHNSALWILSEMGVLGLIPFLGFFASSGFALFREAKNSPIACGVFAVVLVMAAASLGGEILYQRYLWFLLGLGLAEASAARASSRPTLRAVSSAG